jgi:AcrR family transcriptional regulator
VSRYFQDHATRQNKKLRTRAVLFDSALAVFYQEGISNTRLEDITRYAGIANATFYNHFKDKEELILELAISVVAELMEPFDEAVAGLNDAPTRIVILMHVIMKAIYERKSWGAFLGQSFHLVPLKRHFGASARFKVELDIGIEKGSFTSMPDRFQLDQVSSVMLSGMRRLDEDDVNITDRTSENILRLLGMTPADARLAVGKALALLSLK